MWGEPCGGQPISRRLGGRLRGRRPWGEGRRGHCEPRQAALGRSLPPEPNQLRANHRHSHLFQDASPGAEFFVLQRQRVEGSLLLSHLSQVHMSVSDSHHKGIRTTKKKGGQDDPTPSTLPLIAPNMAWEPHLSFKTRHLFTLPLAEALLRISPCGVVLCSLCRPSRGTGLPVASSFCCKPTRASC